MTNEYWHFAEDGTNRDPEDPILEERAWQQAQNSMFTIGWLFWNMQLMIEVWGAAFGFLYIFSLLATDWLMALLPVLTYLVVGVMLTRRNERNPALIVPNKSKEFRALYILAWPVRQAVRDIQHTILTKWEITPDKQPDQFDFHFPLLFATAKWIYLWMVVCCIPTSITIYLEQIWG